MITPNLLAQNARLRANADALPAPELSLTPAAITPTLKGHALGESIIQFLQKSSEKTRSLFAACAGAVGNEYDKSSSECHRLHDATFAGMTGEIHCDDPKYNPHPDPIYDVPMSMCQEFQGSATFEDNRLVDIHLEIRFISWEEALDDATSKYGKPDLVETRTEQNGYGATWDLQDASWSHYPSALDTVPDFTIFMAEELGKYTRLVVVQVTDHKFWLERHPIKTKNLLN